MLFTKEKFAIFVNGSSPDEFRKGIIFAPARNIEAATVNAMTVHGRGVVSCYLSLERATKLALQIMPGTVDRPRTPRYLVSVEASSCDGSGISAVDRALTLGVLGDPMARPTDLVSPGHIMPCVLPFENMRRGLFEMAMSEVKEASGVAAMAWCDILDENGDLASLRYCTELSRRTGVIIRYVEDALIDGLVS